MFAISLSFLKYFRPSFKSVKYCLYSTAFFLIISPSYLIFTIIVAQIRKVTLSIIIAPLIPKVPIIIPAAPKPIISTNLLVL